jgi:outer membrane protein OmpA-like peptidoglycan-associated protein
MTRHPFVACFALALSGLVVSAAAQQTPPVPLRKGLTIVTAIHQDVGDFESIKVVQAVTADAVDVSYNADIPNPMTDKVEHMKAFRSIRRVDLRDAHEYAQAFSNQGPRVIPGTTALGVSAAVLNELKTKGETKLTTAAGGVMGGMAGGLAGMLGGLLGGQGTKDLDQLGKISGTLTRVEAKPVMLSVLVNDQPVKLPAIHAKGTLGESDAEFYFLDDPDNPISLKFAIDEDTLTVVKIAFPVEQAAASGDTAAPQIEQALEKTGRAEVYGIYFDFGSAVIKPESEPVLQEIADVMAKNPSWKLSVEGHTDNIGGDAYNLDLSKKRAAAVKDALVTRYHIAADRLTTVGYGASRPKDTNDTLEGRARNRRVELVRQ